MSEVLTCIGERHDNFLLLMAVIICVVGVYSSASVAAHAVRSHGTARLQWSILAVITAGCTAWATHMMGLLAFRPGVDTAFDPALMLTSMVVGTAGIGVGVAIGVASRIASRRFLGGIILGIGVGSLHYLGELSYLMAA